MKNLFDKGDFVVIIDLYGERIDDVIYQIDAVMEIPDGTYCYALLGGEGIYPESILEYVEFELPAPYEFKSNIPKVYPFKATTKHEILKEFESLLDTYQEDMKKQQIDEALDMYNNFMDLFKMTHDEVYETIASIILSHLKKGTYATIDFLKLLPYLENQIEKYEGENE